MKDVYREVTDPEVALAVFAVTFGGGQTSEFGGVNTPSIQSDLQGVLIESSQSCSDLQPNVILARFAGPGCLPGGLELLFSLNSARVGNGNQCWSLGVKLRKDLF